MKTKPLTKALLLVGVLIVGVISFFPIFIIATTAFKTPEEITYANFALIPHQLNLDNFLAALAVGNWGRYFLNSTFVTVVVVIGSLFFNSLCGYSLARLNFPGRKLLLMVFIMGIMVPPQSYIIPQFIILRSVPFAGGNDAFGQGGSGLLNSYWALIVPFLSGSFGVFLARQYYMTFPQDLADAAKIDGCTKFGTYRRIFVPLSGNLFATLTILKFVATWNDFFYPLVMTNSDNMATVQLALSKFRTVAGIQWNQMMAATLLIILPVIVVFAFAQKYFVAGIQTTGLKA